MVQIALVGAGFQGSNLGRALAQTGGASLTCIIDTDAARAAALATELGSRTASLTDLAADPPEVVVVAVPNDEHVKVAEYCLDLGCTVFLEKPVGLDRDGVQRLVAASGNSRLLAGHALRTTPGIRRMVAAIAAGGVGELREVRAARLRHLGPDRPDSWKTDPRRSGGELLHEIHELDLLCLVGGAVVDATSFADSTGAGEHDLATRRHTVLRFRSGVVGVHDLSSAEHASRWDFSAHGTEGSLRADFQRGIVEQLTEGTIASHWSIFSDPRDTAALVQSANSPVRYHTGVAPASRWMHRLARNCAEEIVRAGRGERSILQDVPALAVLTALDVLAAEG